MKKYEVILYYHTNVTVEVVAEDEESAIEKARQEASLEKYDEEIIAYLEEDNEPYVEEIK